MASNVRRLDSGGLIDRQRKIRFYFDGKAYFGFAGDTLASAMIANGISIAGRSFKYHRPRGIMGAGVEEPSILVTLEGDHERGNVSPTTLPLVDGMSARSIHCWPSPKYDFGAIMQYFARFIPAGFYYKTFMWPHWHLFEPSIRKAAGLGTAPFAPPRRGRFEVRNAHCDVLIAGAGPAGLMAALASGRAGARVILVDEGLEAGGNLLSRNTSFGDTPALEWVKKITAELAKLPNVTHLQQSTVWAWREHNLLMVQERAPELKDLIQRGWRIRAKRVIAATGAIERIIVFAGNDRPGVMLASAAQTYVNRFAVRPGQRAVVFTNNDTAWEVARELIAAGISVAAIVDSRPSPSPELKQGLDGVPIYQGHVVQRTTGSKTLQGVIVGPSDGGTTHLIECDLLAVSGGWSSTVHLHSQSRGTLRWDQDKVTFLPDQYAQPGLNAGAADGAFGIAATLKSGADAAKASLHSLGFEVPNIQLPTAENEPHSVTPLWSVPPEKPGQKAFVDIQNDVALSDIELAHREGYSAVEHAKRYTTGGMAIDQGKTGNYNIIGILAGLNGNAPGDVGTTTFRSPYTPVDFGTIAGGREGSVVLPYRHTPTTRWHENAGAVMYESGARWRRPGYYPRERETFQQTVDREALTVREAVGIYDSAPLGTYAVEGPDSARFLDHIYTNRFSTLKDGNGRYGLMLTEDGLIFDDGVSFRLGKERFHMSTSTGNADSVGSYMEKILQIDRPEWQVRITNLTSQWVNVTLCGPRARDVLRAVGTDIDLSAESFPFMALRDGHVAQIPARVARVSFTGEISFEINVRPRDHLELWKALLDAGAPFGIAPIGSEANHVLRVEKGFLSLGHEVDGTTDPYDLGLGWVMSKSKGDFVGQRSVRIRRANGKTRRELVGLKPLDPEMKLPEGAPLTPGGRRESSNGLVTACVKSVALNRWVGLGLIESGRSLIGETAHVRLPGRSIAVRLCAPVFYDPDGEKMRA